MVADLLAEEGVCPPYHRPFCNPLSNVLATNRFQKLLEFGRFYGFHEQTKQQSELIYDVDPFYTMYSLMQNNTTKGPKVLEYT